jgi:hypothetical protein
MADGYGKKPSKEFSSRYDAAKNYRDRVQPNLEDALAFISPGREADFDYRETKQEHRDDDPEVLMSLPEDLATDFAADLVTYFCPSESRWTEYNVTAPVPEEAETQVQNIVDEREEEIWNMLHGSNFNDVAPQVFFEANHGTIGMWVEQAHMTQPFYCEAVTPEQLLITPGHMGILDRFREVRVLAQHLPVRFKQWPEVDLSGERLQNMIKKPGQYVTVCYGFWVDWKDPGNPIWRCEVTIDKKCVMKDGPIVMGPLAGGCPLLIGRFNPQARNPWGRGPAIKALPDLRVLNKLDESVLEGLDQALSNTLIYPDDGFLDFEGGLEDGRAYAAARGFTREQVYEMNRGVNLDVGHYSQDRLEDRLRAAFYQDGPRQRGDTPPTASQWLDERRRVQQRLGKPSAPLWREFLLPFIQRIERIGIEIGRFDAEILHDGDVIAVDPISPLQKAANQDKVLTARSNLELGFNVFQDQLFNIVDPIGTFTGIVATSGDELTKVRKEAPPQEDPNAAQPPQ